MNDRARAIAILRQARDALADRLTERVLQSKDEILEDAHGLSYVGGIEAIYEDLGSRLSHIGAMLNSLPPTEDGSFSAHTAQAGPIDDPRAAATVLDTATDYNPIRVEMPALPAPQTVQQLALPSATVTFRTFAAQIQSSDLDAAGQSLADLLAIDSARARRCAETFLENLGRDNELLLKAMSLRKQLAAGSSSAALVLLSECFGLQGPEALSVFQHLRNRFAE
jgi:hypothetical protein